MPSVYLQPADYATYGVPNATSSEVIEASALIDGYLDRKDGLIYTVDGSNNPVSMALTGLPISANLKSPLRNKIILSNIPVVALLSVQYNTTFGLPPTWRTVTNSGFSQDGELWLDPVVPPYSDIKIQYIAGWLYTSLPSAIKQSCANLVDVLEQDFFSGNIKELQAGKTSITWFDNAHGLIDANIATMLNPYKRTFA